jgi:2-polyprenyl-3-methyl-5-hydroxy-6-metoxy-1,4-benzoquinol methylase
VTEAVRPTYDFALGDLAHEPSARGRIWRELLPGSRVLDVGCDTGRFGELLARQRGAIVDGIERDRAAAEQAERRLSRVWRRSLDEPGAFDGMGPYDAVLFLDVLEHLFDPWRVLEAARGVLRPGGVMHVVVPNVAHVSVVRRLMQGRFEYTDVGTMDRTHVRWFTRASIRECFEQAGLMRVEVTAEPLVPHLDAGTKWGQRAGRFLTAALPDAFAGSLHAQGYAPVPG